ncbi:MAG: Asp-tRNA(Asn)/Glu-tRNA(Gln) amidotransferase subunit GatA, partial [Candidatus Yonathbacteria bacterium]|nr:Asp-tRNA(Asn)/Glu-tRNA(Gln) amidotransferase subunit GatA [Candidatus Yonathbacteria bacterium]
MINLENLTIKKAHDSLMRAEFSVGELAQAYLDVIVKKNTEMNAYLEVFDDVLQQASHADEMIKNGSATLLTGIPFAVKDNILIKGRTASAASKMLENYTATYDASVIAKLKECGAVFLGRTNMDEFAMGGSTENSAFGPTKNPHDTSRVPGGSSGGSAAAVSMGGALAALGSDTGGSIRQPASLCGVVGLKPTYGSVSRHGLMAMGSSLDQIGPFGKTVEDVRAIFNVIKGADSMDSTSVPLHLRGKEETIKKKMVIGVPEDFLTMEGIDVDVLQNFRETLSKLEGKGHVIKKVTLPNLKYSLASYYIIMPAEASTNLARFDGVRYGLSIKGDTLFGDYAKTRGNGFGKETRRRIMLGAYVLSAGYYDAYYNKATAVRALIQKDFNEAFSGVDVIATPTSPTPAFKIGEKASDPLAMYLADIFTVPINLAGVP